MSRTRHTVRSTFIFIALALLATTSMGAADGQKEIILPATRIFLESITSTKDGTLIIGSLGHGNILRIAPGKTEAEEWIKPGTGGLNSILGVLADEKGKVLWVCSNRFEPKGEATAAKTFDLKTGAPLKTYPLPGGKPVCNDIAVADDGTVYVSDTDQAAVYLLKPGGSKLEDAAKDPLLAGADGLAFGDKTTLYVNSVTTNKFVRLDIGADGKASKVVELKTSRPLQNPDGMRTLGKDRLLMAENSGVMSIVTFNAQKDTAQFQNIKEGLEATPGVTETKGMRGSWREN
jgi:sugar lactone lactonase YvrE